MQHKEHHHIDPLTGKDIELLTAEQYDEICSIRNEQGAELRNEQFFESRGYDDALGQEQWEKERGVVSFEDAFAQGLGYRDAAHREAQEANEEYGGDTHGKT